MEENKTGWLISGAFFEEEVENIIEIIEETEEGLGQRLSMAVGLSFFCGVFIFIFLFLIEQQHMILK